MHKIKYTRYPNNEIRAIHYYSCPSDAVKEDNSVAGGDLPCSEPRSESEVKCDSSLSSYLDISSDFPERLQPSPRKKTKFGLAAKRTLLRMGGAFDTVDKDPQNYIFLTGTIPGGTHEAFSAVAEESPYIVEAIADWLRKTAPSDYWFYCWELQKRGALHIHYCIHPNDSAVCEKILSLWKSKWEDILNKVGKRRNVDMWLRADGTYHTQGHSVLQAYAQRVHTSVAAYMSGYLAGGKDKHSLDKDSPYFPTRWWGASRKATSLLKSLTDTLVVEHSNYRQARYEIQSHYERVLHDSPKAHSYQHKVGIGTTVVSYHPEDKGEKIWQELKPVLYKEKSHPFTSSMIALYQTQITQTIFLIEASPAHVQNSLESLLMTLRGLCFPAPVYGYSIASRDLTAIRLIPSSLNSPLCTIREWERLRIIWCLLQDSLKAVESKIKTDRAGYVCNSEDWFKPLDNHWTARYLGTNEPTGSERGAGGANGSLSPQPPALKPIQQCLSLDL